MPSPDNLKEWLRKTYPSPKVDPEWLDQCYNWIVETYHPSTFDELTAYVDVQLLESDLTDSMLPGTGISQRILRDSESNPVRVKGPTLVQITSITDIGVSAWNLDKTRQVREERENSGAQQAEPETEVDLDIEGEGPIPPYTRSMLRLEITDGCTTLRAMEYKKIADLVLGETPLGYKFMLKNTLIRRGIALLEPDSIILKGHHDANRENNQKMAFKRSLRVRMGLPEEPEEEEDAPIQDPHVPPVQGQPLPLPPPNNTVETNPRSPLREISPPPSPTLVDEREDDQRQPRRRKIPESQGTASSTHFAQGSQTGWRELSQTLTLSPLRSNVVIDIDDDSDSENVIPLRRGAAAPATPDDEFGDLDDWNDPGLLEAAGQVEMAALATTHRPASAAPPTQRLNAQTDVVLIPSGSDSEMEDKENIPEPRRRVKRKLAPRRPVAAEDVIEISD